MKVDIEKKVQRMIEAPFEIEEIKTIPEFNDSRLCFENKGLRFEATIIYLEIRNTMLILSRNTPVMLEKIRMSYFYVMIEIVRSLGGKVRRAHDDGFYIFFQGSTQDSLNGAVKAAMKIKYMLTNEYSQVKKMLDSYDALNFVMGIDDGKVLCVQTDENGLVWSGEALTVAVDIAKKLSISGHIGVSKRVHHNLKDTIKYHKGKKEHQEIWRSDQFTHHQEKHTYFYTSFFWTVS
ncbi:MAG: hypothetical protein Q9M50_00845 [Methylococcales bacterium]|nr:hypothetical protein [Methylococcales bacterium]